MAAIRGEDTRAIARLPHFEIEVLHKPARAERGEQVAILLTATHGATTPELLLGLAQPMLAWMRFMQAAWAPWLALTAPATSRGFRDRP